MPKAPFTIQNFVTADGKPVDEGYLFLHLSNDAASPSGQIVARSRTEVNLGSLGQILDNPTFWENISLTPSDTVYFLDVYNSDGKKICGPIFVTVGPSSSGNLGFGQAFGSSFGS